MTGHATRRVVLWLGGALIVLVLLLPTAALLIRGGLGEISSTASLFPSDRQLGLLFKTITLAVCGTLLATVLAIPGAFVIGGSRRLTQLPFLTALIVLPLLLPPMVMAFGWQKILGAHWSTSWSPLFRTVWIWASWAWPIPALILGTGWSRTGRDIYESSIQETTALIAFVRAVLPSLSRHVLLSGIILMVVFLGEYTIPHANGVFVTASDLVDIVGSTAPEQGISATLYASIPLTGISLLMLIICRLIWPAAMQDRGYEGRVTVSTRYAALTVSVILVTTATPLFVLFWRPQLPQELLETWTTYSGELVATWGMCLFAGVLGTVIGLTIALQRGWRWPAMLVAIPAAVVPGALVGIGILAAYQPGDWSRRAPFIADALGWVYNHWPIVTMGMVARYSWVAILACWLATRNNPRALTDQAHSDGMDEMRLLWNAALVRNWPLVLAGALLTSSLAMSDLAVVDVVRVPWPSLASTILIEKFHRFESGMLASISLMLVAAAIPGAILGYVALRRRSAK